MLSEVEYLPKDEIKVEKQFEDSLECNANMISDPLIISPESRNHKDRKCFG